MLSESKVEQPGMTTLEFSYHIVPNGGTREQAPVNGRLYAGSLETAKKHVQTVRAPKVAGRSDLEAILRDLLGNEIWSGAAKRRSIAARRYTGANRMSSCRWRSSILPE
jgi:hypothetical protein